jgi:hypothetical protein
MIFDYEFLIQSLAMCPDLAGNPQSSYLSLPSARVTGGHHHAQQNLIYDCWFYR